MHTSHDRGKGSQPYNYLLPGHASSDWVNENTSQWMKVLHAVKLAVNDRRDPKSLFMF